MRILADRGGHRGRESRRTSGWLGAAASLLALVAACTGAAPTDEGQPEIGEPFDPACYNCHGNSLSPAPPRGLGGVTEVSATGVGAHRSHIGGISTWHASVQCSSCHAIPAETESPGHIDDGDSKAELTFSALARTGGLSPQLNPDHTCSNVYCHGATLTGGSLNQPKWTQVDGSQKECGTCHGNPPPAPHPASTDCGSCHPSMQAGTNTFLDPSRHINGVVDVGDGSDCVSCHGSEQNSAPPKDLAGNTARSAPGVGAHRQHLGDSTWRRTLACANCHLVPSDVNSPGHLDGDNIVEVPFDGLNPVADFDRQAATCNNLYCHGNGKGSNGTVSWTTTTPMDCGSCHGNPPPAPHTAQTDCGQCHQSMLPGTDQFRDPLRHIDGVVDVAGDATACDSCHGSAGISAPPMDLAGNTNRSSPGVGAHRQHLGAANWRKEVVCESCHVVPADLNAAGHLDGDNVAEVRFTGVDMAATFDAGNASCQNLFCHGNGKAANGSLSWLSTTAMTCASCHASPPPAPHPASATTACGTCHPNVQPGTTTFSDPASHINGVVNVNDGGACDSCHGSGGVAAPPKDLAGNTARSAPGVGAHRQHLGINNWSRAMTCTTCHVVPENVSSPGHLDGDNRAEVPFDSLNPTATVDLATGTCANLYCHGNGRGNNGTIVFTSTTPMQCASCHLSPAVGQSATGMSGDHDKHIRDKKINCVECHAQVINGARQIIDAGLHLDGAKQVLMPKGGTYTASTRRCSNMACHGAETW